MFLCRWVAKDNGSLAWSCLVVAGMGFLRHLLALVRAEFALANSVYKKDGKHDSLPLLGGNDAQEEPFLRRALRVKAVANSPMLLRILDAFMFGVVAVLGFFNMLIAMTYNPALFIALIIGEMIGVITLEHPGGVIVPGCKEIEGGRDQCCH